jgi:hypothetical protein
MEKYPMLYDICQEGDITFKKCVLKNFKMHFRRRLHNILLDQWNYITGKTREIQLSEEGDSFVWKMNSNKNITTKSVYEYLESDSFGPNYKWIWKAKIPLKIQIFFMANDAKRNSN